MEGVTDINRFASFALSRLYENGSQNEALKHSLWATVLLRPEPEEQYGKLWEQQSEEYRMEVLSYFLRKEGVEKSIKKEARITALVLRAYDDDTATACEAVIDPKMPLEHLLKFSTHEDPDYRRWVSDNPSTPLDVVRNLTNDPDIEVSEHAKWVLKQRDKRGR